MADFQDRMKDYIEVKDRIKAFYAAHPQGSLQSEIVEHIPGKWVERTFTDKNGHPYQAAVRTDGLITVKAWAYRTPDDPRPGIGHSWLEIPGTTPYTEGSELENAETSAWGRAIGALGFEMHKSVATRDEIEGKGEKKRGGKGLGTVACASCGVVGAIIVGKPEYGGGWLCFDKKGGCGAKFQIDPSVPPAVSETPPPIVDMNAPITDVHRDVFKKALKEKMSVAQAKVWLKGQLVKMGTTSDKLNLGQFNLLVENLGMYDLPKMEGNEAMSDKDIEW